MLGWSFEVCFEHVFVDVWSWTIAKDSSWACRKCAHQTLLKRWELSTSFSLKSISDPCILYILVEHGSVTFNWNSQKELCCWFKIIGKKKIRKWNFKILRQQDSWPSFCLPRSGSLVNMKKKFNFFFFFNSLLYSRLKNSVYALSVNKTDSALSVKKSGAAYSVNKTCSAYSMNKSCSPLFSEYVLFPLFSEYVLFPLLSDYVLFPLFSEYVLFPLFSEYVLFPLFSEYVQFPLFSEYVLFINIMNI